MEDDGSQSAEPPSPGADRAPLNIEILNARDVVDRDCCARLEARAARVLAATDAAGEIRVRLVGDTEMAGAHQRWKGVAGTTDVLTFDLREPDPEAVGVGQATELDADVLVCVDEARRQSAARGHDLEHELLLYIVHAALHCLGHDDADEASATAMHAEEDRLLSLAGIGPVFATEESASVTGAER